jgi:hypothetical protein
MKAHLEATLFAVEIQTSLTIITVAAAGDAGDGNPVPGLKALHPFSDFVDDTHWLVPKDEPLFYREQAMEHMQFAATDGAQDHLDDYVSWSCLGFWPFFHSQIIGPIINKCLHIPFLPMKDFKGTSLIFSCLFIGIILGLFK